LPLEERRLERGGIGKKFVDALLYFLGGTDRRLLTLERGEGDSSSSPTLSRIDNVVNIDLSTVFITVQVLHYRLGCRSLRTETADVWILI
jgi:hypothetical protein